MWAYSVPGGYLLPVLATTAVWALVLLAVGIKAVMQPVFGVRRPAPWWHPWARWALVLGIMVAPLALTQTGAAVRAGTALAESAVAAYAADPGAEAPARFGPYSVQRAEHLDDGGAPFLVENAGFLRDRGFAYRTGGTPPGKADDSYEHLHGPWYAWTRDF